MAKQNGTKVAAGLVNAGTAGEPMVQIANRVPSSTHQALKVACATRNVAMGIAIERAIGLWLAAVPAKGKGRKAA